MPHGSSKRRKPAQHSFRRKPPDHGSKPQAADRPPVGQDAVKLALAVGSKPAEAKERFKKKYASFGFLMNP